MASTYEVRIGDYTLEGVQSLNLRFSMRELADSFSVTTSDLLELEGGERAEIRVNGVTRLVGEVQSFREVDSLGSSELSIKLSSR